MVYHFLIYSDEVPDFRMEIQISSDATFRELNDFIVKSVEFAEGEMTFFSICDRNWIPFASILLSDMGLYQDDDEPILMDETPLNHFLDEGVTRILFTFDILADRSFFVELKEALPSEELSPPELVLIEGAAPTQMSDPMQLLLDDVPVKYRSVHDGEEDDEDEYGLDDFDIGLDDLDPDGFDFSE